MTWDELSDAMAMAATIAFAVTAVLAIRRDKDVDLLGAVMLGFITAVGGGTIRDVIMDVPVFWGTDLSYAWYSIAASAAAFYGRRLFEQSQLYAAMNYLDSFGAIMFGVQACGKVWDLDWGRPFAPVLLGMVTAIGGGLTRDVLAGRTTLLMKPELYATPVMFSAVGFSLVLAYAPDQRFVGSLVCIALAFAFRVGAIHYGWTMPSFLEGKRVSSDND